MAYSQKMGTSIDGSDMKEQMLWLSSVVGGILICVTVYHLTGAISSVCFKVYSKLYNDQKVEWNNRGFSTVHAFIVAVAALHLLLFSDLFKEDLEEGYIIDRRSTYSNTTFGISIGYFLSDLAMILWRYPALGGKEYILHHGLSLFSIICALVSGQGHMYILMVLFSEITTPFVNLRWYLDVSGEKKSKLYVYNGIALFFGWLDLVTGTRIGIGLASDGLYRLPVGVASALLTAVRQKATRQEDSLLLVMKWHERLGHLPFSTLRRLFPGLFSSLDMHSFTCEICQLAKHVRASYPLS